MAIIQQRVFNLGLYPIEVPSINFIGYQNPVAPGSQNTGSLANSDVNDVYPGSYMMSMGSDNTDKFIIRFTREPNITDFDVTLENPDTAAGDFTGNLVDAGDGITFSATITGVYDFLIANEKNVITTILEAN